MKKLKFLLLALAATISVGAWAETDYTNMMSPDWIGSTNGFQNGKEHYQDKNITAGEKVLYQSITAPETGIYEIKFYAVTNCTADRYIGSIFGEGIAVAYATTSDENTVTIPMTVLNRTGCTLAEPGNIRTLSIEAAEGETIEYGLKNIAEGGNWYTIQGISIKMKTVAEIYQPVYDEALKIYDNSDESVTGAKAEFFPYIEAMETALNGTLAEAKTAADNLAAAQAIYMSKSTPQRNSGVKYDFTSKMNMAINAWTCVQGNGPAQYGFTGATETYNSGGPFATGKVMYQTITGLANGEYEVQFYGVANSANGVSSVYGTGYAQAYANSISQDIEVKLQNSCTPSDFLRTITCTVTDGTLEFGLKNIAAGGNWYLCKAVALYMTGGPDLNDYRSAIAENLTTATSIQSSGLKMQSTVKEALNNAIENAASYETETVISVLEAMNQNLSNAIAAANKSIADYEALKNAYTLAETLYKESADGASVLNDAITTAKSGYTNADVDGAEATTAMKTAIETYLSANNTNIVVNGTFDSNKDGWTSTTGASAQGLAENKTGDFTGKFWENWNSTPKTGKMYQTNASALPEGKYLLRIAAFGDQVSAYEGSNLYVYANDQRKAVVSDVPTYYYVPFTLTEDAAAGSIEYGLVAENDNKSAWLGIDNVSIYFLDGMSNFYATDADYAALESALSAVSDKVFGFEKGEYAPYNNIEAAKAIAHAKTIDNTVENTVADVRIPTNTINNAVWVANETEVNAVYDGSFNLTTKTDGTYILPIGWTNLGYNTRVYNTTNMGDNKGVNATSKKATMFAKFTTEYGTEAGYTMPLKKGVYSLNFIYGGWNEQGTRVIKVYNASNEAIVTPNEVTAKDNQAHVSPDAWSTYSGIIEILEDGEYVLSFYRESTTAQNQICISDIELKKAATANMTITDANWGTFCAPFDVTIPEGVKAYTAEAEGNPVTFTEVTTTIPAGTPVVVYSAAAVNQEFNDKATATGENCQVGALVGVYAATSDIEAATGYTNYVLQSNTQGVGFYKVAEGSTISLNANRCYMTLATSAGAKDCVVLDGIVTGINEILNPTKKSVEGIFDLNGRKFAAPQKGINIINGVKVIVK